MSSSSSGMSRCTRMPRFILAGSKAQLEMPMKATCTNSQHGYHVVHFQDKHSLQFTNMTNIQHGPLPWQKSNMLTLNKHPTSFTFMINIQQGSLSWQTSNNVHFHYKIQHGSFLWQTFNMVHFHDNTAYGSLSFTIIFIANETYL